MKTMRLFALFVALLALGSTATATAAAGTGQAIVDAALAQVGQPYRNGGQGPGGFDCSGLVRYAYNEAGIELPHSAILQKNVGTPVTFAEAQAGDLLFFRFKRRGRMINHVAIYLGDGKAVHAAITGKVVRISMVNTRYWLKRLETAIRVLPEMEQQVVTETAHRLSTFATP